MRCSKEAYFWNALLCPISILVFIVFAVLFLMIQTVAAALLLLVIYVAVVAVIYKTTFRAKMDLKDNDMDQF